MHRRRLVFSVIVVCGLINAGVTVVGFGTELQRIDAVGAVEDRIDTRVAGVAITADRLSMELTLENPARIPLRVRSVRVRLHNESRPQLATGAADEFEASALPPRGTTTVRIDVRIAPDRVELARAAIESGATITLRIGMAHRDTEFAITRRHPVNRTGGR